MRKDIKDNIQEIYRLMKYDRSKTLLEQGADYMVDKKSMSTAGIDYNDYKNTVRNPPPKKKKDVCDSYVSPEACLTNHKQASICPGNKNDFDWKNHCYYPGYGGFKPKLLGVKTTDKVKFVDVEYFRDFMSSFYNIGNTDAPAWTTEFLRKRITNYNSYNAQQFADFRKNILSKEDDDMARYEYITRKMVAPGVLSEIEANGKTYHLMYEFSNESAYQQLPSQNIDLNKDFDFWDARKKMMTSQNERITTLRAVGYFSGDDEFEGAPTSDTRSDWDKFIDDWGTIIQVVGAIGFGIAGAYTGGATWALAAEIAVELGFGLALAQRALEKGDKWGAGMEIIFGLFPLIKTTNLLTGISDDAIKGLANKWRRAGLKEGSSPAEIGKFWTNLTQEEAEALARISRKEGELTKYLSNLVGDPKTVVRNLLKQIENTKEAQEVIIKFWSTSAGRELKYQLYLMGLDAYFSSYFTNEYDELSKQIMTSILAGADLDMQKYYAEQFLLWTPEQIKAAFSNDALLSQLDMGKMGSEGTENVYHVGAASQGIQYNYMNIADKVVRGKECPPGYTILYHFGQPNYNEEEFRKYIKYTKLEDTLVSTQYYFYCIATKHIEDKTRTGSGNPLTLGVYPD